MRALVCVLVLLATATPRVWAAEQQDVENWISAYSAKYSSADYLYVDLLSDSMRVARCESAQFDARVLNNERRGGFGEIGTFQFMPGPRSIFWQTPSATAGFDYWDPEANVAGAVWLISRGFGPKNWTCW